MLCRYTGNKGIRRRRLRFKAGERACGSGAELERATGIGEQNLRMTEKPDFKDTLTVCLMNG